MAELKGRVAELLAAGQEVVVVLYLSGHAKGGELHLAGTHLPLVELREFAESTQAQLRLVFVDACDSGLLARAKGGRPVASFDVTLEGSTTRGQVLISSSGPTEAAQEWDLYQSSLFTHHLLTGLRGDADADGDGAVSLVEAYHYTWRRTVAEAALAGQHPHFDFDLTGGGTFTLSRPSMARAAVVFPPESSGRFVVASQPRADVVSEVSKRAGAPLRLGLPPGRYVIRDLRGQRVGVLDFQLPFGGVYTVDPASFSWRSFSEVATKGGFVEIRSLQLSAGAQLESAQLEDAGPRVRSSLGVRRSFDAWLAGVGAAVGFWRSHGAAVTTDEWGFEPWLEVGYRFLTFSVTPTVGLRGGLDLRRQAYVRDEEAEIQRVFGVPPLPVRWSLGLFLGPFVGGELRLSERMLLGARLSLQGRWLRTEGQGPWSVVGQAELYVGIRL
jgi:hypothetical protein